MIQIIKKIKYLIKALRFVIIIYIDYSTAIDLMRQISLNTTLIKKLNLRLVRVSKYLQQFYIKIHYKLDKINIISNILLYLINRNYDLFSDESKLNILTINIFSISLIQISDIFK